MRKKITRAVRSLIFLAVLAVPFVVAFSAGGAIEGKVTDPKGAAVAGASVTVSDDANGQRFTAQTDQQGQFKVEGLPAGAYTVVISADGFNDIRKENVKVEAGASVPLTLRLEIAAVEASVNVSAGGLKANSDPLYQQLRQQGKGTQDFSGPYATVNNLVLNKEASSFTLRSGELYFLAPVEGHYTAAVFIGDGEFNLVPPTEREKTSLKIFTNEPSITEQFSTLTLRFTDKTFEEVKNSPAVKMGTSGPQVSRAADLFRENQTLLRRQLRDNGELQVLADLYAPGRAGFFTAFINGKRFSKLVYLFNPLGIPNVSPEEVLLFSYGTDDFGSWTAFHRVDEYKKGTASSSEDHRPIDITKHDIDGTIKGTRITASDRLTFRALVPGRIVLLNLFASLRVSRVVDEQGKELNFIQEAKDEDADLGIIMPQIMAAGKSYTITVQYEGGGAIADSGGGNFFLIPRLTWYPNNGGSQFGDRAIFDMTFHYPKGYTFVGTGAMVSESKEGDAAVAKWSSGTTELAVSGFNYGNFKKRELADKSTGYNLEFYANEQVPDEVRQAQLAIEDAERRGADTYTTLGSISTTKMADSALSDAENATRVFTAFFGKIPYSRIAMTQQPAANFGQAWPTLVFMPYTAFMDATQRAQLFGNPGAGTNSFFRYVGPHEIAHQWWGHTVGWDSYHDQWMSEGFAEFSASLYVQFIRKDMQKFIDFWEAQRQLILEPRPATNGRKPYTVGPVTQGYRLNSGKTGGVARFSIYPKGAYILHMIRMMMYDQQGGTGDSRFQKMMKDFILTHYNQDVSTEDLKAIVEKHLTKDMDIAKNGKIDWFFDEYVYGTEMPSYRFDYQINSDGSLTGKITQSGVSDNFGMLVPLYADFGKGWIKLGSATMIGNNTLDITNLKLPATPKKVAICALNDVLAASIQNTR